MTPETDNTDTVSFRMKLRRLVDGNGTTHTQIKRHRAKFLTMSGAILLFVVLIASVSVGPTGCYDPITSISSMISAIIHGGGEPGTAEITIYDLRLPRTIAALGVGIGLSIAGSMYQAIIRNPLVDPYIMGVSSGAGTSAIAVMVFGFTFFGLFPTGSVYSTAFAAIVGGLLAFSCTMVLGELAGGTNNSYVLSGVIVGLIFGAVQTVMITFSADKISNTLLWMFGSFSTVTFAQAIPVFIVALVLSLLALRWTKEFNLILLGENQSRQMGLDAHKFSILMLVIASVLTSVCVAFVGIIGFVGLVVPHLCRMVFGGDHRLVMPASMVFGGTLMVAADIVSRMLMSGYELPVGAITTIVGVPVFAYLLFKRGKIYNG